MSETAPDRLHDYLAMHTGKEAQIYLMNETLTGTLAAVKADYVLVKTAVGDEAIALHHIVRVVVSGEPATAIKGPSAKIVEGTGSRYGSDRGIY